MSESHLGVDDANQTFVPDSFIALYRDARSRLTASRQTIAARYELCEDMANLLTDHCSTVHFRDGVDEAEVLHRVHLGLLAPPVTVEPAEAGWVVRRTAELLGWPAPSEVAGERSVETAGEAPRQPIEKR